MTEDDLVSALREIACAVGLEPAATEAGIAEAERVIGSPMPPLLRRLYMEVGNGGFGPGVLGVPGCNYAGGTFEDIADLLRNGPDPDGKIPHGLVLLHDWGCAKWSLIDFRDPDGAMWGNDSGELFPENMNLSEWLAYWVEGRLGFPGRPIKPVNEDSDH